MPSNPALDTATGSPAITSPAGREHAARGAPSPAPGDRAADSADLEAGGAGEDPDSPRSTEELLERFGRRYAVLVRGVGGLVPAVVAAWLDAPVGRPGAFLISAGFMAWTAVVIVRMRRAPARWWAIADTAVVAALAMAIPVVDSPTLVAGHNGWVVVVVTTTIVSTYLHQPPRIAWGSAVVLAAAYFIGGAVATTPATVAYWSAWLLVISTLAALAWRLVIRGGREADAMAAQELAAKRNAEIAAARRADQRRHWAAVHDTAATTLLMIGNGEVRDDAPWLRHQLDRDIAALDGSVSHLDTDRVDLVAALRAGLGRGTAYTLAAPPELVAPREVVDALAGAAAEAVENVRRHSCGAIARVTVTRTAATVVVEIADDGRGFDPQAPRTGRGLDCSILARMRAAAGRAEIESAIGRGTTVRLECSDG